MLQGEGPARPEAGRRENGRWTGGAEHAAAPQVQGAGTRSRAAGLGRNRHAGLPPAQRAWPLFTPVACGWRGWLAGPGSTLTAGALGLILSCLCELGRPCLSFPSVRQDESACPGAVRRVQPSAQNKSSAFRPSSPSASSPTEGQRADVPPAGSQARTLASPSAARPAQCPSPLGRLVGGVGGCGVDGPSHPPLGKAGLSPWGPLPVRRGLASPDWGGHHRLWEGTRSPAPGRPRPFIVYKFLSGPWSTAAQGLGAPGPNLSLVLGVFLSWCPSPSLVPSCGASLPLLVPD